MNYVSRVLRAVVSRRLTPEVDQSRIIGERHRDRMRKKKRKGKRKKEKSKIQSRR